MTVLVSSLGPEGRLSAPRRSTPLPATHSDSFCNIGALLANYNSILSKLIKLSISSWLYLSIYWSITC
jgi:hypothetical protein